MSWCRIVPDAALLLFFLASQVCLAQWEDVSTAYFLTATATGSQFGCGMSCADFNGDGHDDLTFAQASGSIVMYAGSNDGFDLVGTLEGEGLGTGVLWVDVDDDGDLDLFAGRRDHGVKLYIRASSGSLLDQSVSRGVPAWSGWRPRGISACDFDRDGDLDVYIASYHIEPQVDHHPNAFLINDGSGHFTLADDSVGVDNGIQTSFHGGWFDYDGDGWQDLWVINDRFSFEDALYRNQGDGTFVDVASEVGLAVALDPMTATIFDPDRDGDWDLFTTDVANIAHRLHAWDGSGFEEIAAEAGVAGVSDYGWGACAVDVDGDMNEDLMVATLYWPFESNTVDNALYMGVDSALYFEQDSGGWPNEQFPLYHIGRCDLDGDAVPDVVCHGAIPIAQVLRNTNSSGAHRVAFTLVGTPSNSHAVGAVLKVYAGGVQQMQQVDAGADYVTQHSYTRFFGLGSNEVVDSVVVTWPQGAVEMWGNLPADEAFVLIEGTSGAAVTPLERTCAWDEQGWLLPFNPDSVEMTWNGDPVTSDTIWVSSSDSSILEASWWNGRYTMSFPLITEVQAFPGLSVTVNAPACAEDAATVSWEGSGAEAVFWMDTLEVPLDSTLDAFESPMSLSWQYSSQCWLDTVINLEWPTPISGALESNPPPCAGGQGTAVWELTGGTPPLTLDWFGADPDALGEGVWPVIAVDMAGCTVSDTVVMVIPDSLIAFPDWTYLGESDTAQVFISIDGGTPPYSVNWSGGLDDNGLLLAPGTLVWLVEDDAGCITFGNITLDVNDVANVASGLPNVECVRTEEGIRFIGLPDGAHFKIHGLDGRLLASGEWQSGAFLDAMKQGPLIITAVGSNGTHWVFLR